MSGRILDGDGGSLEGATVELHTDWMTEEERSRIRHATATTDASGRYLIEGLREHPGHALLVKHERHALGWLYPIVVKENANTENPDIRLEKGRSIRGRVVDKAGRPVPGARIDAEVGSRYIDVQDPLEAMARLETRRYTTDSDGRYEIPHLAALQYDIHASKDGFITAEVDVLLSQRGSIVAPDVVLEESFRLSVKVTDRAGRPIADAAVRLDGFQVPQAVLRTDATGVLEVRDLQALPDGLEVSAPGYIARTVESKVPEVEVVLESEQP
jgi:protocatechuate 3,4-dioxygenase beta subunit